MVSRFLRESVSEVFKQIYESNYWIESESEKGHLLVEYEVFQYDYTYYKKKLSFLSYLIYSCRIKVETQQIVDFYIPGREIDHF